METRRRMKQMSSLMAVMVPIGIFLTPGVAYADSTSQNVNFDSQYQQNQNIEAGLEQNADQLQISGHKAEDYQHRVRELNERILALYAEEQIWAKVIGAAPNSTAMTRWIAELMPKGHGHKHDRGDHRVLEAWARLASRDHDDHGRSIGWWQGRLTQLQNEILHLQSEAIHDLQQWIALGNQPVPGGNPTDGIASISISASAGAVQEGGHVSYVAQILNGSHQPIQRPGVQIDFSLIQGNSDGTLSSATARTNGDGQAVIDVTAGNAVGGLQVSARVDGTALPPVTGPVIQVQAPATASAAKLTVAGTAMPGSLDLGQSTSGNTVVYPETSAGAVVSGDTLRVTTSNPAVLALAHPDASTNNVETLPAGQYTLPPLAAKAVGSAVVTVTDLTAPQHPSTSFTIDVAAGAPVAVEVVNPNGTMNTPYAVQAGSDGPFELAVVNAAGVQVPSPADLVLSAAQVNQIIGGGTAVRPLNGANEVTSVQILAGHSTVSVYADNVAAGSTHPTPLNLVTLSPSVVSAEVQNSNTVVLTYSVGLKSDMPMLSDFWIDWGTGRGTPESVSISGNTVTLKLWGASIQHGDNVTVAYNPSASDSNSLTSVFGEKVAAMPSVAVNNPL